MTLDEILALIPEGDQYSDVRDTIMLIGRMFPDDLGEITPARVGQWVSDIDSGRRTEDVIRSDILEFIVGAAAIQSTLGVDEATAQELIAGTQTFANLNARSDPGTEAIGDTVIPEGGTLVKVRDPEGSDADFIYYITYDVGGMQFAYEVGDQARFDELFGSEGNFDSKRTVSQAQFDEAGYVAAGSIDQQLGATDSIQSQFQQDLRDLGLEDLPAWISGSTEAMTLIAQATAQQWTSGRLWVALSETEAFSQRFGEAIDRYLEAGVTIEQAVDEYVADEAELRRVIRRHMPAGTELTTEYLNQVIANGWTATGAEQVLTAADSLRRRPNALAEANRVLEAAGIGPIDEVEFINAINGQGQADVVEAINTASAAVALSEAGLDDVDTDLLLEVVDTSDRVLTVESFRELAQQLSFNLIQNFREIEGGDLGISRDAVIAAAFGEEDPEGRTPGEVLNLLARFERDRRAASQGFGGGQAFQDNRGRLRIAGLSGN